MLPSFKVKDLCVHYKYNQALKSLNFPIHQGVTAVIGPNGSGKSTLLRCLAGVLEPSRGTIVYCGEDISANLKRFRFGLGYLPQDFAGYSDLTVAAFLRYISALKLIPTHLIDQRLAEIVSLFRLADQCQSKLSTLSRGHMQRLGIAQAVLNDPDVLILDEPTVNLDIEERNELLELIRSLAAGRVVIFSTHFPMDAEACADRVVVLSNGELMCNLPTSALRHKAKDKVWHIVDKYPLSPPKGFVTKTIHGPHGVHLRIVSLVKPYEDATSVEPSLEDAYVALVNHLL